MKILANLHNYNYQPQANRPAFKAGQDYSQICMQMAQLGQSQEELELRRIIPKLKITENGREIKRRLEAIEPLKTVPKVKKIVKALRGILLATTLFLAAITGYFAINNDTDKDKTLPFAVATAITGLGTLGLSILKTKEAKDEDKALAEAVAQAKSNAKEGDTVFVSKNVIYKLTNKGLSQYMELTTELETLDAKLSRLRKINIFNKTDAEFIEQCKTEAERSLLLIKLNLLQQLGEIDIESGETHSFVDNRYNNLHILSDKGLRQYIDYHTKLQAANAIINASSQTDADSIAKRKICLSKLYLLQQLRELPE